MPWLCIATVWCPEKGPESYVRGPRNLVSTSFRGCWCESPATCLRAKGRNPGPMIVRGRRLSLKRLNLPTTGPRQYELGAKTEQDPIGPPGQRCYQTTRSRRTFPSDGGTTCSVAPRGLGRLHGMGLWPGMPPNVCFPYFRMRGSSIRLPLGWWPSLCGTGLRACAPDQRITRSGGVYPTRGRFFFC